MQMNLRTRRFSGFTFMEMVVALTVITLLAAFLFPGYARTRRAARRTACASNFKQLGAALHLYAQDYSGRFPVSDSNWSPLLPYLKNTQVFTCPEEPFELRQTFQPGRRFVLPEGIRFFSSYQYRGGLANDDSGDLPIARDWLPWHLDGANVLHLDGAVVWHASKDAPTLPGSRVAPPAGATPFSGSVAPSSFPSF